MSTSSTSKSGQQAALHFYPTRFYPASPTFNAWAKLTIAGVHALRAPEQSDPISGLGNFADQHAIAFHMNYPIRFVRVVGTVVAVEELSPRFALLTLDDGSGATIELKITRRVPEAWAGGGYADATSAATDAAAAAAAAPLQPTYPSNTTVDNVSIVSAIGVFDVLVDGHVVDIGTVLKTKCTLSSFRNVCQLALQRVSIVRNTAEEAACWTETAAYFSAVLARPWQLSEEKMAALDKKLRREERRRKEEERVYKEKMEERQRKEKWRRELAEKTRAADEKMERNRRKEELIMNKGALI